MKITLKWLKSKEACEDGIDWYKEQKETDIAKLIDLAEKDDCLNYCNWAMARKLKKMDRIRYSIYAAEKVLYLFEDRFPDDKRPREAIKAAKNYLNKPTEKNKSAAASAAWSAESAASAAASATWSAESAESAASAAASATWSAESAESAESAARSAARSVARSAESANYNTMLKDILLYGLSLLGGEP